MELDDMIRRGDAMLAAVDLGDERIADAIRAIPPRGVGVKPLVWAHQVKMPSGNLEVRTQKDGRIEFFTQCGLYTIRDRGTPDAPMFMLRRLATPLMGSAKLSELYEAAQKDHEARILSALAPAPDAREEGLREAIDRLRRVPLQEAVSDPALILANARAIAVLEAMIEEKNQ